jgi:hypothetical protein
MLRRSHPYTRLHREKVSTLADMEHMHEHHETAVRGPGPSLVRTYRDPGPEEELCSHFTTVELLFVP